METQDKVAEGGWREELRKVVDGDVVFEPLGPPKSLTEQFDELRAELAEVKEQLRVGLTKVDVWGEGVDDTLASIASGCLHGCRQPGSVAGRRILSG